MQDVSLIPKQSQKPKINDCVKVLVGAIWLYGKIKRELSPILFEVYYGYKKDFNAGKLAKSGIFDVCNMIFL